MERQRLSRFYRQFSEPGFQRLLIIISITTIFWNGLWGGFARADQIAYLHQISQFDGLWEILLNSPSWNRTQSAGDFIVFRPVQYWLMGISYYFFGYNFFLWQLLSLFLHIIVLMGVHSLLMMGRLRITPYPLLLTTLFGVSFLGAELVLWHHMVGYLLFSAFSVFSIYFLVKFLGAGKIGYGCASLVLGILAEFTHEFGAILNALISISFFYQFFFADSGANGLVQRTRKINLNWGLLFFFSTLSYPVLNLLDFSLGGHAVTPETPDLINLAQSILTASSYAILQIAIWTGGWLFPAAYKISAGGKSLPDVDAPRPGAGHRRGNRQAVFPGARRYRRYRRRETRRPRRAQKPRPRRLQESRVSWRCFPYAFTLRR